MPWGEEGEGRERGSPQTEDGWSGDGAYAWRYSVISRMILPQYGQRYQPFLLFYWLTVEGNVFRQSAGKPQMSVQSDFTYPLIAEVVGAQQMTSKPVSSISLCSPLPSGTWRIPGLFIPWCCLLTCFSVFLVFFPLSLCLVRWFWPDLMNGRHSLHFSLHLFTIVRRSLLPCFILNSKRWRVHTWMLLHKRCYTMLN